MTMRLPVGPREMDFEDVYAPISKARPREAKIADRPPIPPAVQDMYDDDGPVERPAPPPHMRPMQKPDPVVVRSQRAEPRFDRQR